MAGVDSEKEGVVRGGRRWRGRGGTAPPPRPRPVVQGFLAHKKTPPPQERHTALGIGLL